MENFKKQADKRRKDYEVSQKKIKLKQQMAMIEKKKESQSIIFKLIESNDNSEERVVKIMKSARDTGNTTDLEETDARWKHVAMKNLDVICENMKRKGKVIDKHLENLTVDPRDINIENALTEQYDEEDVPNQCETRSYELIWVALTFFWIGQYTRPLNVPAVPVVEQYDEEDVPNQGETRSYGAFLRLFQLYARPSSGAASGELIWVAVTFFWIGQYTRPLNVPAEPVVAGEPICESKMPKEKNVIDKHTEVQLCSTQERESNSRHMRDENIPSYVSGRIKKAELFPMDNERQGSIRRLALAAERSESSQHSSEEMVKLKDKVTLIVPSAEKGRTINAEPVPVDNEEQGSIIKFPMSESESSQQSSVETIESKATVTKAVANAEIDPLDTAKREMKRSRNELKKRKHSHLEKSYMEQPNLVESVTSKEHATDKQTRTATGRKTIKAALVDVDDQGTNSIYGFSMWIKRPKYSHHTTCNTIESRYNDNKAAPKAVSDTTLVVLLEHTDNSNRNGFWECKLSPLITSNKTLMIQNQAPQGDSTQLLYLLALLEKRAEQLNRQELHLEQMFVKVDKNQQAVHASLFSLWTYLLGRKLKGGLDASEVVFSIEDLYNSLEVVSYRSIDSANIFPDTIRMFVHFPMLNFSAEGILVTANGKDLHRMRDSGRNMKTDKMALVKWRLTDCNT